MFGCLISLNRFMIYFSRSKLLVPACPLTLLTAMRASSLAEYPLKTSPYEPPPSFAFWSNANSSLSRFIELGCMSRWWLIVFNNKNFTYHLYRNNSSLFLIEIIFFAFITLACPESKLIWGIVQDINLFYSFFGNCTFACKLGYRGNLIVGAFERTFLHQFYIYFWVYGKSWFKKDFLIPRWKECLDDFGIGAVFWGFGMGIHPFLGWR